MDSAVRSPLLTAASRVVISVLAAMAFFGVVRIVPQVCFSNLQVVPSKTSILTYVLTRDGAFGPLRVWPPAKSRSKHQTDTCLKCPADLSNALSAPVFIPRCG